MKKTSRSTVYADVYHCLQPNYMLERRCGQKRRTTFSSDEISESSDKRKQMTKEFILFVFMDIISLGYKARKPNPLEFTISGIYCNLPNNQRATKRN